MATWSLRFALALGLAGAFALAATDATDAKNKRAAYKKPKVPAYVAYPYAPPGVLNERECVTQYDNRGVPVPAYYHCESAFRRLYSR